MGRLSSTKHSADRPPLGWVLDVLIAVLAVAASLPELLHESAEPPALTIPVLVVVTSPLVLRRLFPMTVFTLVVIAAAATALWSRNFLAGPAVLITLFTVAAMKPRGKR